LPEKFEDGLHVFFCKRWAPFFEIKQRWTPFVPGFSRVLSIFSGILLGFCPGFQQIKTFGVRLRPTSCTTAFITTSIVV